jgi:ABC-type bacteriocin/lantibiotic exporter with double-glycine peptidase domain
MGLLKQSSGEIFIDNQLIDIYNSRSWQSKIAHVPQSIFLTDSTIAENIALGIPLNEIDFNKYNNLVKTLDLNNYFKELSHKLDTKVGFNGTNLSGGQKQMISLARSLYKDSELIIFDEPTSALDEVKSQLFKNVILSLKGKKTIIVVTHEKNLLEKCFDKIFEINSGNLELQKN